jgi:hypothetical protein
MYRIPESIKPQTLTVPSKFAKRLPTLENAVAWQFTYEYFNDRLFDGKLPDCLITLTRRRRTLGYFRREAFADKNGEMTHEISLNPTFMAVLGDAEALGTLVHEMAHLWREEAGPANRNGKKVARGYHDRVWARQMADVGLMPSDTGRPGGKKTGFRMDHYVIDGGPFDLACRELLISEFGLPWADNPAHLAPQTRKAACKRGDEPAVKNTRALFECAACQLKAYAKYSAKLICGECRIPLIAK